MSVNWEYKIEGDRRGPCRGGFRFGVKGDPRNVNGRNRSGFSR